MKRNELNYHQHHLHINCPKFTLVYPTQNTMQKYRICWTKLCLIIVFHSIPSMALQPLSGHGLPQKPPPFFSVFCSSPPFSHSWDQRCVTQDDVRPLFFSGFPFIFFKQSKILLHTLRLKFHPSDGVIFKIIICQDMYK